MSSVRSDDVSRETQLAAFSALLTEANEETNLVSRRLTPGAIRAMVDAFAATLDRLGLAPPHAMLDVGTGGGLPGIPLAIAHPGTDVILVESRKRRVECLRTFLAELALPNATLLAGRAEQFSELHGAIPLVTAFGVGAPLAVMDIVEPFLDESGVGILSCPATIDKETWASILLRSAMLGLRVTHERDAIAGPRSVLLVSRM